MSKDEVKIVKPELSLNKKLGNIKFEQAFDTTTLTQAEKVVASNEKVFKEETLKDFAELNKLMAALNQSEITAAQYKEISTIAFSIKSRAKTGGFELASSIANSMYKFCDAAAEIMLREGHRALKLHQDALTQVFENKFPTDDAAKTQKLIAGLEAIAEKFTGE